MFKFILLLVCIRFYIMTEEDLQKAREQFDSLMIEAEDLYSNGKYNQALAKIQMMRNLLRANNLLDNIMINNLDKLHKVVLEQM